MIVVGEPEPEVHIRAELVSEGLNRIIRVVYLVEDFEKLVEPLLGNTAEQMLLGVEIEVDRPG